jgi:hypothetical protein
LDIYAFSSQVRHFNNCTKVAEDFVSPENVSTGVEPAPPNGSTEHNDEDVMISFLVSVF